jgi:hypothetical protein
MLEIYHFQIYLSYEKFCLINQRYVWSDAASSLIAISDPA